MTSKLILIRQSGLRVVDETALLDSLDETLRLELREVIHVDTQQFAEDVAVGEWSGQYAYLQNRAAEVRRLADLAGSPEGHYGGLAEIPHVIAFGAALGDERKISIHEYDRDKDSWKWPETGQPEEVVIDNPVAGPLVTASGVAVLRVAISAAIQDVDVRAVVGEEKLADVTVRFAVGHQTTTRVRSEAQLQAIREKVRIALADIKNFRPNVEVLHLFVAAPNSVCLAVGQELVPRNSPPVQTYVYRPGTGPTAYRPAILISAGFEGAAPAMTDEEIALASRLRRDLWGKALGQIKTFAARKEKEHVRAGQQERRWYTGLEPNDALRLAAPFPALPPIDKLVNQKDEIDPEPFYQDYGYDPEQRRWRLSNELVLGMYRAVDESEEMLLPLLRLFFFHEYVHAHHSLTKYTAVNVGKFANALERLDYTADTFAILNELDFQEYAAVQSGAGSPEIIRLLGDQVNQILVSFWAFDGKGPHSEMQVRRVRRYMNWYWRLAQLRRAETVQEAVNLFTRSPAVELAGVRLRTDGERRVFYQLREARSERPEVAIVLEDEKLLRLTESDSASISALIESFRTGDHSALVAWFRPVFEQAKSAGAVFPGLHPLVIAQSKS